MKIAWKLHLVLSLYGGIFYSYFGVILVINETEHTDSVLNSCSDENSLKIN